MRSRASSGPVVSPASAGELHGTEGDLRVLLHRPELCMAEGRGTIFAVLLTAMRSEWLAQLQRGHVETAIRYGGARPFIALVKLDERFPLEIGFDYNLGGLRSALEQARPHLAACAVIVSFGGVFGFTMRQALRLIGFAAQQRPPMQVCSTAAEAVCWIEPYAAASTVGPFDRVYCLQALRTIEALLGADR